MHQFLVRHPFIFLGGGRKSFELPCIYVYIRWIISLLVYSQFLACEGGYVVLRYVQKTLLLLNLPRVVSSSAKR